MDKKTTEEAIEIILEMIEDVRSMRVVPKDIKRANIIRNLSLQTPPPDDSPLSAFWARLENITSMSKEKSEVLQAELLAIVAKETKG